MASGKLLAHWQAASMTEGRSGRALRSRELMAPSVPSAVARAQQQLQPDGSRAVICVTGSLHAAAAALAAELLQLDGADTPET